MQQVAPTLALAVALVLFGGCGCTWVEPGTYVGVTGRALRSTRRPDRALNYETAPLCGTTGPTLFPFARERYAHTPFRLRVLEDADTRVGCSIDVTGRQWRELDALAEDEYRVYLEFDGLLNQQTDGARARTRVLYGYKLARQHPLTVAKHLNISVQYVTRANGTDVEAVSWHAVPVYARLEPGAFEWTYSVEWREAAAGSVRAASAGEDALSSHVHGMQYISILVCFAVTLSVSVAMQVTIRRFIAPYIVDGFTPLRHVNCGACFQLRMRTKDVERASTLEEELSLMNGDAQCRPGAAEWRNLVDDVFRPSRGRAGVAVLCGVGTHVFTALLFILAYGSFGPATHMRVVVWLCGLLAAVPAGYVCGMARYYMRCARVMHVAIFTSVISPGCIVTTTLVANAALLAEGSAYAVPTSTALPMLAAWALLTGVLFTGGFMLYRNTAAHPRCAAVARAQPVWSFVDTCTTVFHGVGVWLGVAVPMFIIISSVWTARVIHVRSMFILLLASFLMWTVLVSSFAIMTTYLTLNRGRWAWANVSFWGAASSGVPAAVLFAVYYMSSQFHGAMGKVVYVCQALPAIVTTALASGTISLLSSTLFVRALYGTARLA